MNYTTDECLQEYYDSLEKQLAEKDAMIDWLADAVAWFGKAFENNGHDPIPVEIEGIGCANYWKEKAQEAMQKK